MIDLTVIVVSHGHENQITRCLRSLNRALEGIRAEVVVVDNTGRGNIRSRLDGTDPPTALLVNRAPAGLSANINRAARRGRGRYLLQLNPDTVHARGQISKAIGFMEENSRVGILGCRLVNPDGTVQPSYRRFPTVPLVLARGFIAESWPRLPWFYRYRMMVDEHLTGPSPVDWVFGAFLLFRRDRFFMLNGCDEGFRLYYEDVDLCIRFRKAGLITAYYPEISFIHEHQRHSARNPLSPHRWWHMRSAVRLFIKHRYIFHPPRGNDGKRLLTSSNMTEEN